MTNPDHNTASGTNDPATPWRNELADLPPGVIPNPHRTNPDIHPDIPGPMHGTDSDNRSVAPGEGSGNSGSVLDEEPIDFAEGDSGEGHA